MLFQQAGEAMLPANQGQRQIASTLNSWISGRGGNVASRSNQSAEEMPSTYHKVSDPGPNNSQEYRPTVPKRSANATAIDDLLRAWCRERRPELTRQLKLLRCGAMRTYEDQGSGFADTSKKTVERINRELAELDELLASA